MRPPELSSRARWLSRARPLRAALASILAVACSTLPEREPFQVDCSPEEDVELNNPRFDFEPALAADDWFAFGDETPGSYPALDPVTNETPGPTRELIEDGGRCGSTAGLVVRSYGHNDWGAGFGTWQLNAAPLNGEGWEGLAIWARTADQSDRSVTLLLLDRFSAPEGTATDPETGAATPTCRPEPSTGETNCSDRIDDDNDQLIDCDDDDCCGKNTVCGCGREVCAAPAAQVRCSDDPNVTHMTVCPRNAAGEVYCVSVPIIPEVRQTAANQGLQGETTMGTDVKDRYDCGNAFQRAFTTTRFWTLYLLPFSSFHQDAQPNRSPAGMDTAAIHQFMLRTPREAQMELWLDDIGLYRHVR